MSDDDSNQEVDENAPSESVADDVGDPVKIERKRKRVAREADQIAQFWAAVFADPIGRRAMWSIMEACHTFETKFACGPNGFPQPEATWHALGEQNAGRAIFDSWLIRCRAGALAMLDEHHPLFAAAKERK